MIHNKTNVLLFLICSLLPTTFYGMELPMSAKVIQLWQNTFIREQSYKEADIINDILIDLLQPNITEEKKKEIIKAVQDLQQYSEYKFNADELAAKIIYAKQTMAKIATTYEDQWPKENIPNDTWNEAMANEAIQRSEADNINPKGMLKIINEIIDEKIPNKYENQTEPFVAQLINNAKTRAKENIKKALDEKIEAAKTEKEKEAEEKRAEREKIEKERVEAIKKAEQEQSKTPRIIEPEKVILEKPIEEQQKKAEPIKTEPIVAANITEIAEPVKKPIPLEQAPQTLEPEKKKEEPVITKEEEEEILAAEIARTEAQKQLKIKAEKFSQFIKDAEKKGVETGDIEPLVKEASQEEPLTQKRINYLSKRMDSISAGINKGFEKQKKNALEAIQKYPEMIAKEIKENKDRGLGTVIVHPIAERLMNYIKNLAAEANIEIVPDKWLSITFGKEENGTLSKEDTFIFKQLSDEHGTREYGAIEYLKHPGDKDTSTIIANPNKTYLRDSTIVPKIDKILTELTEKPITVEPKQVREALEERIQAAKNKVLDKEKQKAAAQESTTIEAEIKREEEKKAAEEKQQIKNLMTTMKITEEQAAKVFSQQKDLEKHLNYFAGLINEAKRIGLNEQKIQELKNMTDNIKNKKIYSLNINDIDNEISKIKKTFDDLDKELETQLTTKKELGYIPSIVKEIEDNKKNGIGTVLVHPDATDLINYIKELAKEAKVEILPNAWTSIPFKYDTFKFKQLTDDVIEYLKSPHEDSSTIIVNPNLSYIWDYTIVPLIADKIANTPMDPQTVLSILQERINNAHKQPVPIIESPGAPVQEITQPIPPFNPAEAEPIPYWAPEEGPIPSWTPQGEALPQYPVPTEQWQPYQYIPAAQQQWIQPQQPWIQQPGITTGPQQVPAPQSVAKPATTKRTTARRAPTRGRTTTRRTTPTRRTPVRRRTITRKAPANKTSATQ